MIITLIRHGESAANIGEHEPHIKGDYCVPLSDLGEQQAFDLGRLLDPNFFDDAIIYCSPYYRTRETLKQLSLGAGKNSESLSVYEDPRLREVERGYTEESEQLPQRLIHGWFYYRYHGGESAADCYDRTSQFLETLMRNAARKKSDKVIVVSHGMAIRCFVMRFFHLTVEQFETMSNPENCDVIRIAPRGTLDQVDFYNARWEVGGLRLREGITAAMHINS